MKIRNEHDVDVAASRILIDTFTASGNDAALFADLLARVASQTHFTVVSLKNVRILSIVPTRCSKHYEPGELYYYTVDTTNENEDLNQWFWEMGCAESGINYPCDWAQYDNARVRVHKALKRVHLNRTDSEEFKAIIDGKVQVDEQLVRELEETGLLFVDKATKTTYIVSKYALATLAQRIEAKGEFLYTPSITRDMLLSDLFAKSPKKAKFMYYTDDHSQNLKIFMVASDTYKELPLHTITDLYLRFTKEAGLGQMHCDGWTIDHSVARIRFTFTDIDFVSELDGVYEDLLNEFTWLCGNELPTPGVEILSSDIGDCAFIVRGFWKFANGEFFYSKEEVARKHSGEITVAKILEEVRQTIFAKYIELPKALLDAFRTEVTPREFASAKNEVATAKAALAQKMTELRNYNTAAKEAGDNKQESADKARAMEKEISSMQTALDAMIKRYERLKSQHERMLESVLREVFRQLESGSYAMKRKWMDDILAGELNPDGVYNAYDLITAIMNVPFDENSKESQDKMRKAMSKLPFLEFERIVSNVKKTKSLFEFGKAKKKNAKDDEDEETV